MTPLEAVLVGIIISQLVILVIVVIVSILS